MDERKKRRRDSKSDDSNEEGGHRHKKREHHHHKKSKDRDRKHKDRDHKHRHKNREKDGERKKERGKDKHKSSKDRLKKVKKLEKMLAATKAASWMTTNNITKISEDDYFARNFEFRLWLKEEHGLSFDDFRDTDEAKLMFTEFVDAWNNAKLEVKFYSGLQPTEVSNAARTNFKWNFKNVNQGELDRLKTTISSDCNNKEIIEQKLPELARQMREEQAKKKASEGVEFMKPTFDPYKSQKDRIAAEEEQKLHRLQQQHQNKQLRDERKLVEEELVPRETGRDAKVDKAKARALAAKDRDLSPEHDERTLLGGGDDIKDLIRRRDQRQEQFQSRKREETSVKLLAFQAKEEEKMRVFKEMVARGQFQTLGK
mmetsp:Transcript_19723/g.50067  ORF Transcript_19723/g.50067 Transcript_19723/m.50067 type:complete len:371 (-) Transcript_19723:30-1142(-)|eukprot:CAMPEP_0177660676 /NCGR_PEP_ID=MMETSP0447-20121125/18189_1 /TAXON_ID=0 /ORGANISM="Stygamoeba regulata, Strain BSH-02190019" /LENGTH=370 /DNA_ID=CAMNT_0019165801 /DNA_START=83 /DNA_END=1195 /DNA_ORIENTATION=-